MQKPCISVIVPVYRVEQYLPECIRSILAQTYPNFELILVDDGSPDGCPALCDDAAQQDIRIRVIHQKNAGLSAARNAGIDAAHGTWIALVDSDDFIRPNMLETLLQRVQADKAQLAVCDYSYAADDGTPLPHSPKIPRDEVLSGNEAIARIASGGFTVAWNRLYHRSLFAQVRFPVGRLHEDEFVAHLIYAQCQRVSVVAKPLYCYRQRRDGITQQHSVSRRLDQADGICSRAEFALTHSMNAVAYNACGCAMNLLADTQALHNLTEAEQAKLSASIQQTKRIAWKLLHISGVRKEKMKLCIFLLSRKLYRQIVMKKHSV